MFFFFKLTAAPEIDTDWHSLSLNAALPIADWSHRGARALQRPRPLSRRAPLAGCGWPIVPTHHKLPHSLSRCMRLWEAGFPAARPPTACARRPTLEFWRREPAPGKEPPA